MNALTRGDREEISRALEDGPRADLQAYRGAHPEADASRREPRRLRALRSVPESEQRRGGSAKLCEVVRLLLGTRFDEDGAPVLRGRVEGKGKGEGEKTDCSSPLCPLPPLPCAKRATKAVARRPAEASVPCCPSLARSRCAGAGLGRGAVRRGAARRGAAFGAVRLVLRRRGFARGLAACGLAACSPSFSVTLSWCCWICGTSPGSLSFRLDFVVFPAFLGHARSSS